MKMGRCSASKAKVIIFGETCLTSGLPHKARDAGVELKDLTLAKNL